MKNPTSPRSELWYTVYVWLRAIGSKLSSNYCKEEMTTHPDYPALISVVDFLDSGGMAYHAVQADSSYISEFTYPLLAHIKQPGDEYLHLILDASDWEKEREITKHWTGVAVFPGENAKWSSDAGAVYRKKEVKNKILSGAFICAGVIAFAISTSRLLRDDFVSVGLFGMLSLTGLIFSMLSLGAELGFQGRIANQICGTVGAGGCEQVLKSRYAKGFWGVTPADASVLYFASQFTAYLFGCWYHSLVQGILFVSFAGAIVAAWSIYTQAVKLKEWCALCLAVAAVLILQCIIAAISPSPRPEVTSIIVFAVVAIIGGMVLFPIKQLIRQISINKLKLRELKKWKLDADLFLSQLWNEKLIDTTIWEKDLLLGDPNAPLHITVACNPYCGPCARAHTELDKILHRFAGKVNVKIRFLFPSESENNILTVAAKAILRKAAEVQNNGELQELLSDWYAWMDYGKWVRKWLPDVSIEESRDIADRLRDHSQWIKQSTISFPPTFFINGRKLPGRYSISDLVILIPQLSQRVRPEQLKDH